MDRPRPARHARRSSSTSPTGPGAEPVRAPTRDQLASLRHPRHPDLRRVGARLRHRPAPRAPAAQRRPGRSTSGRGAASRSTTCGGFLARARLRRRRRRARRRRTRTTRCSRPCSRFLGDSEPRRAASRSTTSWLETNPQNIPGTPVDRPNWVQRSPMALDELLGRSGRRPAAARRAGLPARFPPPRGRREEHHRRERPPRSPTTTCGCSTRAPTAASTTCSAPTCSPDGRGAPVRGVGAQRPLRSAWSATSTAGTPARHPLDAQGGVGHLDRRRRRRRRAGRPLQVPHRVAGRRLRRRQGRPVRGLGRAAAAHGVGGAGTSTLRVGRRRRGWPTRAARNAPRRADVDLRDARRVVAPRRATSTGRSTTASWPSRSPTTLEAMGFTHVELLPIMEHPFYGSWGYQTTGLLRARRRASARPQDFMYLIDTLHQRGIGVILDWVPSHFPSDEHGLGYFDGTHLFEHADPRLGLPPRLEQPDLQLRPPRGAHASCCRARCSWLDRYHVDGLRVDAVASMLYLDYSRKDGEWIPNEHGGNENLGALALPQEAQRDGLPRLPRRADDRRGVHRVADGVAADRRRRPRLRLQVGHGLDARHARATSSATRSTAATTRTSSRSGWSTPSPRTTCCRSPTTRSCTARARCSAKMPGDRVAAVRQPARCSSATSTASPARSCCSWAASWRQRREWNHDARAAAGSCSTDPRHAGRARAGSRTSTACTATEPALHELDCRPGRLRVGRRRRRRGQRHRVPAAAPARRRRRPVEPVPARSWSSPTSPRCRAQGYAIGVPTGGRWDELANSDAAVYGGSGWGNLGGVDAVEGSMHGRPFHLPLVLPPLAVVYLAPETRGVMSSRHHWIPCDPCPSAVLQFHDDLRYRRPICCASCPRRSSHSAAAVVSPGLRRRRARRDAPGTKCN